MATTSTALTDPTAAPRRSSSSLLTCGIIGGPMFIVGSLAQALLRDGYDLRRHHLSTLVHGEYGWIQVSNFVVSGLLLIAFAVGVRRVLRDDRGRWLLPALFGVYGACLIVGGLFPADPAYGFPPGTPNSFPETMSWPAVVHAAGAMTAFGSLLVATLTYARRSLAEGSWPWAAYSVASGLGAACLVFLQNPAAEGGGVRLATSSVITGLWITLVAVRLKRRF